jgi:branched-chain amino acid transport system substrate-binding protein
VVGIDLASAPFYSYSDFYPEGQTNDSVTYANVSTAKAAGASNLGDLYCAEAVQCAEGVPEIKAAAQKLGLSNKYNAEIAMSAPNYTAQCVAAQDAHVQSIFIGDSSNIIARVGSDCSQQGYKPIFVTEGLGYSALLANSPGIKDNLWDEFNTMPFFAKAPEVQAMNTALDKYYPGLRENQTTFSELAAQAWVSGLLLADAVKAGGLSPNETPSAQEITKGLTSLHGDTLDGWSPPLTFTAGQPHHVDCWFTAKIQNGVPSLANNGQTTCENASS